MKRARKAHENMTQGELAAAVRRVLKSDEPSQAMISKIESGASTSSKFVKPICQVLSIALPEHFADESDRAWVQLGRVLRARNLDQYRHWLAVIEQAASADAAPIPTPEPEQPKREKRPTSRK